MTIDRGIQSDLSGSVTTEPVLGAKLRMQTG